MDGACGACQVKDAVHFQQNRFCHIVADQFEAMIVAQVVDIHQTTRKVVVKANNLVSVVQKTFTQVTSQKTSPTSN
jgi:hypothetical protein